MAIRGYGQLLDGAVFVTPFFAESTKPAVRQFVSEYNFKYGKDPDLLSAQAYDAAMLMFNSYTPGVTAEALNKKLRQVDGYIGVTGKLVVAPSGEIKRRMSVLRFENGDLIEVMSGGVLTGVVATNAEAKE